jgi:CheY-like chemotaxis protein
MSEFLKIDTETQPISSATNTISRYNHTNELFGFKQSEIMIIDANETSGIELNSLLQNWQCDALCFNSAEEALSILAQQEWKPRLIIADFHLADNRLDVDAIKIIQNFYACDIQAIILIDDTDPIKIQLARENGFTILHKPINAAQLRFVMQKKLSPHIHQVVSA